MPTTRKPVREVETEVLPGRETEFERDERFIRFISQLMDSAFVIPGTNIRFGLDPIIGLLPGVGDTADALISTFLIARSAQYGVPKIVVLRMLMNVLINTVFGSLPVIGDAFSVWWKSNAMNYELLRKHATARRRPTRGDWLFVIGIIGAMLAFMLLILFLIFTVVRVALSAVGA